MYANPLRPQPNSNELTMPWPLPAINISFGMNHSLLQSLREIRSLKKLSISKPAAGSSPSLRVRSWTLKAVASTCPERNACLIKQLIPTTDSTSRQKVQLNPNVNGATAQHHTQGFSNSTTRRRVYEPVIVESIDHNTQGHYRTKIPLFGPQVLQVDLLNVRVWCIAEAGPSANPVVED